MQRCSTYSPSPTPVAGKYSRMYSATQSVCQLTEERKSYYSPSLEYTPSLIRPSPTNICQVREKLISDHRPFLSNSSFKARKQVILPDFFLQPPEEFVVRFCHVSSLLSFPTSPRPLLWFSLLSQCRSRAVQVCLCQPYLRLSHCLFPSSAYKMI